MRICRGGRRRRRRCAVRFKVCAVGQNSQNFCDGWRRIKIQQLKVRMGPGPKLPVWIRSVNLSREVPHPEKIGNTGRYCPGHTCLDKSWNNKVQVSCRSEQICQSDFLFVHRPHAPPWRRADLDRPNRGKLSKLPGFLFRLEILAQDPSEP